MTSSGILRKVLAGTLVAAVVGGIVLTAPQKSVADAAEGEFHFGVEPTAAANLASLLGDGYYYGCVAETVDTSNSHTQSNYATNKFFADSRGVRTDLISKNFNKF